MAGRGRGVADGGVFVHIPGCPDGSTGSAGSTGDDGTRGRTRADRRGPGAAPTAAPAATGSAAGAATSAPAAGTANVDWDTIVADANKEGKLVVAHSSLESNGRILQAFQDKFPSIQLERSGMAASVFAPRVVSEERQGLYAWDLLIGTGFNSAERVLGPAGALGDIRPYLQDMPADVKDDAKWAGGFMMLRNPNSPDSFVTDINVGYRLYVNRAALPAEQFSSADQLIDPKFKGKIAIYRPDQSSAARKRWPRCCSQRVTTSCAKCWWTRRRSRSTTSVR